MEMIEKTLPVLRAALVATALSFVAPAFAADAPTGSVLPPGPAEFIGDKEPPAFTDAEKAVDAFKKALTDDDLVGFLELLGLNVKKVTEDPASADTFQQIREGAARRVLVEGEGDSRILKIGRVLWPFPFPLKKFEDGWAFDTYEGIDEIVDRRVGENEMQTIDTLNFYVDAQRDYFGEDRDEDGVLEYAQKLISSEGLTDGIYWPETEETGESPAGALDPEQMDKAAAGRGYFGYKYRILTRQGDNIAGGAHDYVVNGNMINGHALVAWPAVYGLSGIHTFLVNHSGVIYEADLGEDTAEKVGAIDTFNPGDDWDVVPD
jgi:hypothetical protein